MLAMDDHLGMMAEDLAGLGPVNRLADPKEDLVGLDLGNCLAEPKEDQVVVCQIQTKLAWDQRRAGEESDLLLRMHQP